MLLIKRVKWEGHKDKDIGLRSVKIVYMLSKKKEKNKVVRNNIIEILK